MQQSPNGTGNNSDPSGVLIKRRARARAMGVMFVTTLVFYCVTANFELLKFYEWRMSDYFFQLRSHVAPPALPSNIVVVSIDEISMQEIGKQWPWPRTIHADLVSALDRAGAKVVAFDMLFPEPTDEKIDLEFAQAIKVAGNVILGETYQVTKEQGYRQEIRVLPLPLFKKAAQSTGALSMIRDDDGFIRRNNLTHAGIPTLPRQIVSYYLNTSDGASDLGQTSVGFEATFAFPPGPIVINYLGVPRSIPTISYYQVLSYQDTLPKDFLKDKIVLVGHSLQATPDLNVVDHYPYPLYGKSHAPIAGVEIHATIVDMLIRDRYFTQIPQLHQGLIFLAVLILGAVLLWRFTHWAGALFYSMLVFTLITSYMLLFIYFDGLILVVTPFLFLTLFFIAERVYGYAIADRDKRFIQKAFKHYISPALVEELIENPGQLKLSGEFREASVLFTDLVGFTSIVEGMEPMAMRRMLTEYFDNMLTVLLKHDGTLDKFIGDAMMCLFGVPVSTSVHPRQAAATAWDMQCRLAALNFEWQERFGQDAVTLAMRIGVNTGTVVAGNVGATNIFNYTVMGDAVNLAARLESANKQYGTNILLGESTFLLSDDEFDARKLDCIRVQGKKKPVVTYELLGRKNSVSGYKAEQIELYHAAFSQYQEMEFQSAITKLEKALLLGLDKPSEILRDRCLQYLISSPSADWDGVYTMTKK